MDFTICNSVRTGSDFYDAQGELSDINEQITAIRESRAEQERMRDSYTGLADAARNAFSTMAKGLKDIPIAIVKAGIDSIISSFKRLGDMVQKFAIVPFKLLETVAKKPFPVLAKALKHPITCSTKALRISSNTGLE